jgi:hypothetical protein
MHATIYSRERKNIGSTWSRNTCLDSLLAATQSLLLEGLEDYQSSQRLNNNDQKQAILYENILLIAMNV